MNTTDQQTAYLLDASGSLLVTDTLDLPDHPQADKKGYYRARDQDYVHGAAVMRRLKVLLQETIHPATTRANALCPECGGPAERVFGRNSNAWITYPLGCGHARTCPQSPERSAARERTEAALAELPVQPPVCRVLPPCPEVFDQHAAA